MPFNIKLMCLIALAATATAHMALLSPCPRYSSKGTCPALPSGQQLDYSITSPIPDNGVLCKSNVPYPTPCATWTAGQSITVTFQGSAIHGGGHCQWSISYDNGNTFVVLYEVLTDCFTGNTAGTNDGYPYTFNLPSDLPSSSKAVFAWSWVNAVGNREFYMNCADVVIKGSSATTYTGREITIANHDGYPTIAEFTSTDKGLQYYTDAKNITITASGGSSTSGDSNSDASSDGEDSYSDSVGVTPLVHDAVIPSDSEQGDVSSAPSDKIIYGALPSDDSASGESTTLVDNNTDSGDNGSGAGDIEISPGAGSDSGTDDGSDDGGTDDGSDADTATGDGNGDTGTDTGADTGSATDNGSGGGSSASGGDSGNTSAGSSAGASGGACSTSGQMVCSGTGFQVCDNGNWVSFACAPGTACKTSGSSIICDFAS
ncbi:hypothetical protein EV175_002275 [Coemansia sp. RSA 1933]|nr:hypothetical protein EV175_002275 [Coemansia sp. RSA 1933]